MCVYIIYDSLPVNRMNVVYMDALGYLSPSHNNEQVRI